MIDGMKCFYRSGPRNKIVSDGGVLSNQPVVAHSFRKREGLGYPNPLLRYYQSLSLWKLKKSALLLFWGLVYRQIPLFLLEQNGLTAPLFPSSLTNSLHVSYNMNNFYLVLWIVLPNELKQCLMLNQGSKTSINNNILISLKCLSQNNLFNKP